MGGAQAIAALAYGTESVAPVDVIVGPGQRLRAGGQAPGGRDRSGIDGVAGPSELVVVAADGRRPRADRARPAGAGRARRGQPCSWLISPDAALLDAVGGRGRAAGARAAERRRRRAALVASTQRRARRSRWPTSSPPSTSSWWATRPRRCAGQVRCGRLPVRRPRRRHRLRRLRRGLQPRAAHGRRGALPERALGGHLPAPDGAGIVARRGAARAWRPPAPRWPAPRAFPSTPSRWSAAREPHRRDLTAPPSETDIALSLDLDGVGRGHARDRRRLLRPHARRAGAPRPARPGRARRGRPRDRARTTRWRTPGWCSARRSTRRSATAPASRATARPSCRWTRRAPRARSTSPAGRSRPSRATLPPSAVGGLRHGPGRGVLPRRRQHREADAARARRGRHATPTTWSRPRSRRSRGRCAQRGGDRPRRDGRAVHEGRCCERASRSSTTGWATCARSRRRSSTWAREPSVTSDHDARPRGRRRRAARRGRVSQGDGARPRARARRAAARAASRPACRCSGSAWACSCCSSARPSSAGPRASGCCAGAVRGARRARAEGAADRLEPGRLAARDRRSARACRSPAPSTTCTRSRRGRPTRRTCSARPTYGSEFVSAVERGAGLRRPVPPREVGAATACALLRNFVRARARPSA